MEPEAAKLLGAGFAAIGCGLAALGVGNVFAKLGLPPSDSDHRRVLAVLTWLRAQAEH